MDTGIYSQHTIHDMGHAHMDTGIYSQHTIHDMGHDHMDTGIYIIVSTQYMPWDMLIWTQVYT